MRQPLLWRSGCQPRWPSSELDSTLLIGVKWLSTIVGSQTLEALMLCSTICWRLVLGQTICPHPLHRGLWWVAYIWEGDWGGRINPVDELTLCVPYSKLMPIKQFCLLSLWDKISLPHKKEKQLFGPILHIIGIEVDPNCLTYRLSLAACNDLIDELSKFCWLWKNKGGWWTRSSCCPLKQWQCVRATQKPASSMAHSTVTRALALWAHI